YVFGSLMLEVCLLLLIGLLFKGFIGFYFIPTMLDSIMLLSTKWRNVSTSIVSIVSLCLLILFFDFNQVAIYLCFVMMSGLCFYIKYEQDGKFDAQLLYDQLRISQKELRHANEELELYASSISELAVLKERNRISREIHDSVGHALSTAMIQLNAMEAVAAKAQSPLAEQAKTLREFIKLSYHDVR
ncbi:MAG TPA: sensor histidine kinase, partial [Firmicutes bacterium]|nr:sensor histidine kinase [Bacillota bacterium]